MRIVNRKEFLKMPNGTVYSKYKTFGNIEGFYVKEDTLENDWIYQDLFEADEEYVDIFERAEKDSNYSLDLDLDCCRRDGMFDNNDKFIIFEDKDINKIISKLRGGITV